MAYIIILERELKEAVSRLGDEYYYKFLFNSENKEDYYEKLHIKKLNDNMLFAEQMKKISLLRSKKSGAEYNTAMKDIITSAFEDNSHIGVVNDAYNYKNMVLVLAEKYIYSVANNNEKGTALTYDNLITMRDMIIREFKIREGMKIYTLDLYTSGMKIDEDYDYKRFVETQNHLMREEDKELDERLMNRFNKLFRFRVVSFYSKLQEYDLDEIMEVFKQYGWLDNPIFQQDEIYIYDDQARIILAKRLATLASRNDIEVLLNQGIMKPGLIQYDIGLDM